MRGLDKHKVLIQYLEMKEEIKDIRNRIKKIEREIENLEVVSDTVRGTRKDGTIGPIKITGYPTPAYYKKKNLLILYKQKLQEREEELLQLTIQAEEYIGKIKKSELRIMARLYFVDGLTWIQVAHQMNHMFPNRKIAYTEDSCRMRMTRFLEN